MTTFRLSRQPAHEARADVVALFCTEGQTIPSDLAAGTLRNAVRQALRLESFSGAADSMLVWHAPAGFAAPRVAIFGLGKKDTVTLETVRRSFARLARRFDTGGLKIAATLPAVRGDAASPADRVRAAVEGTLLGAYRWRAYIRDASTSGRRQTTKQKDGIATLTLLGSTGSKLQAAVRRGTVGAEATLMARELVCEQASVMTPRAMERKARAVARATGLQITVYDEKKLARMGMGCFLGVSRGSTEPARMIHLVYKPRRRSGRGRRVALVGKGVTFDSGGLSLKPAVSMEAMKTDMAGAAAVLATLSTLKQIDCRHEVHGILMMTENMPSGCAYKPGDILRSFGGTTVEVLNTDAEGRLALADGLEFALTLKPDRIIDVATLTGACVVALGTLCSGVMGFDSALVRSLLEAAAATGEKLWELPLVPEYRSSLDSKVADIKHVGGRWGGAITAGLFLSEFAGRDVPWAHIDIAGPSYTDTDQDLSRVGGTGHPVRTLIRYLEGSA